MTSAPRVARSTEGLKDRQPPVKGGRVIVVAALGATQTIAWASSYYMPAILGNPIAQTLHLPISVFFGSFSGALLLSAVIGPLVGRRIDRHGGRGLLAASNLVIAAGLIILAAAHGIIGRRGHSLGTGGPRSCASTETNSGHRGVSDGLDGESGGYYGEVSTMALVPQGRRCRVADPSCCLCGSSMARVRGKCIDYVGTLAVDR